MLPVQLTLSRRAAGNVFNKWKYSVCVWWKNRADIKMSSGMKYGKVAQQNWTDPQWCDVMHSSSGLTLILWSVAEELLLIRSLCDLHWS